MSVSVSEWDEGPSVLAAAWRYRWLLPVALLLGGLLGYALAGLQPTLYEGVSRVFVSEPRSQTPNDSAGTIDPARNVANQAEFISSTPVLQQASKRYGNGMNPDELRRRLTVEASNESDVITIRALDPTAAGAARLADAIALAYNDVLNRNSQRRDTVGLQQAQAEEARLRARLNRIRAALAVNRGDPSLIAESDAVSGRLRDVIARELQLGGNGILPSAAPLWESAEVPQQPAQPKRVRLAAAGALLFLLSAVALAWWRTWRRQMAPAEAQPVLAPGRPQPAGSRDTVEVASNGTRRPSVRPPSPKPVPSEVAEEATSPAAGTFDDRRAESPVLTPVAALAREYENGDRGSRSDDVEAPLAALTPESIANFEQLTSSILHVTETLGDHRLNLYDQSLPQIEVEELAEQFDLDLTAILLDDGEGLFKVVGDTGLTAAERQRTVVREDVQELFGTGPRRLQDAEQVRFCEAGGPGTRARALVIVPLGYEARLGMLVVGPRQHTEDDRPVLNDQEIEDIAVFARVITPSLAAWVLLRQLRQQLQGME